MIVIKEDANIFDLNCNVLVNPVNCVGAMGKGLALEFKKRYPLNFKAYQTRCDQNKMIPGKVFSFFEKDKTIINFPTKNHWKYRSQLEWIELGLQDMIQYLKNDDLIGMPLLGCGEGKLNSVDVIPLIMHYLDKHPSTTYLCVRGGWEIHQLL